MNKPDLALDNLRGLISHKIKPNLTIKLSAGKDKNLHISLILILKKK